MSMLKSLHSRVITPIWEERNLTLIASACTTSSNNLMISTLLLFGKIRKMMALLVKIKTLLLTLRNTSPRKMMVFRINFWTTWEAKRLNFKSLLMISTERSMKLRSPNLVVRKKSSMPPRKKFSHKFLNFLVKIRQSFRVSLKKSKTKFKPWALKFREVDKVIKESNK